jgi:hypothetical protein
MQQPTKSRPYHWDIFMGDGAQGNGDRGGYFRNFSAIGLQGKKRNLPKFVVALGGCELTMSHKKTAKFMRGRWIRVRRGRSTGGECRGAVFDRSGGDQGGRGEKII